MHRPLEPDPVRRWVGYALVAAGVTTMATAGLCSLGLLGSIVASRPHDALRMLAYNTGLVGIFGGVPALLGWLVLAWGRKTIRPEPPRRRQRIADWTSAADGDDNAT